MRQTWSVADSVLRSWPRRRQHTARERARAWRRFVLTALLAVMILVTVAVALTWGL
jgi:hypothetical protein